MTNRMECKEIPEPSLTSRMCEELSVSYLLVFEKTTTLLPEEEDWLQIKMLC